MIWTTDKPTVPGWYWWRQLQTDTDAEVLRVEFNDVDHEQVLIARSFDFYDLVGNMPGDWSGPIVPPIDYQAQAVADELPYSN